MAKLSAKEALKNKPLMDKAKALATPDGYALERLGLKLHPKQAAVLRDLFQPKSRVVFRCANEVGKTRRVVTSAILYAIEILDCNVVSTAGVFRQVAEQLIPSLKSFSHLYNSAEWQFLDKGIKRFDKKNKNWTDAYTGFSAKDDNYFQGYHKDENKPLLIIIDESQGVADEIFKSAEDRCNPTYFMACGSPGDPAGMFYQMETNLAKHYTHHRLTRPECLTTDGWWIDPKDIQRMVEKYGETNPFVRSTVFGEFSEIVEGALISLGEYDRCLENAPQWMSGDVHGFCDFAAGRDKNVFALRRGNKVEIKRKWVDRDTMSAVGQFLAMFTDGKKEFGLRPEQVSGDADGLGLPMVQRMREMDWPINEFHGGQEERYVNGYRNQIAEAWGEGIKKIKLCRLILPNDPDLKAQVLGRKGRPNSSGQMEIEKKEDYKKRCGESPDEADAFFGCCMPAPNFKGFSLSEMVRNIKFDNQWEDEDNSNDKVSGMRRFCS